MDSFQFNETQLSPDEEDLSDSTSFSGMALAGLILASIGAFSISYIEVLPLAILGALFGMVTLWIAKRSKLSRISMGLGVLAIVLGTTSAAWGIFQRKLNTDYDLQRARQISDQYLNSLSKGELEKVYYLVGFQYESSGPQLVEEGLTEMQKAKRKLADDATHVEIQKRGSAAQWEFLGIDGQFPSATDKSYTYKLRYRDLGQTIPPVYWIYVRKSCGKWEYDPQIYWFVDNLERARLQ